NIFYKSANRNRCRNFEADGGINYLNKFTFKSHCILKDMMAFFRIIGLSPLAGIRLYQRDNMFLHF
ncbi:MAG: hypothetical protein KBF51_11800, partial [Chitinophagales bacterium]|nr:hypothetical protein [Chitinophagales bacterium]